MSNRMILIGVVAAVVTAGACGGPQPLSQRQFEDRANVACDRTADRLVEIRADSGTGPTVSDATVDEFVDTLRDGLDRLRELEPPEKRRADFSRFMDVLDREHDKIVDLFDAERRNDFAERSELLTELTNDAREHTRLANGLGIEACGSVIGQ